MRGRARTPIRARAVAGGRGRGEALATSRPLAFWGGIDPATGVIIEAQHELRGASVAGKVLVFPRGVGSSSGCGIIMEMVRRGVAPAAMVNLETEAVLALGPIIARELYGRAFPIVTIDRRAFRGLRTGDLVEVDADAGLIRFPGTEGGAR